MLVGASECVWQCVEMTSAGTTLCYPEARLCTAQRHAYCVTDSGSSSSSGNGMRIVKLTTAAAAACQV